MKRNLLLLTAVVLAAVVLAGCTWPIIGNAVKINVVNNAKTDGKLLVTATDLAKEYKKNSVVEITFEYTEDWDNEEIEFSFEPKDVDLVPTELPEVKADEEEGIAAFRGGFLVEGTIGKKAVTITTSVKVAQED